MRQEPAEEAGAFGDQKIADLGAVEPTTLAENLPGM